MVYDILCIYSPAQYLIILCYYPGNYSKSTNLLPTLALHCPYLTHIALGSVSYTDNDIHTLVQHCTKLTSIKLFKCNILTNKAIYAISAYCSYLQCLSLTNNEYITDESMCILFEKCVYITSLYLSTLSGITDLTILALKRCYLHLRSLTLHCIENISDTAFTHIHTRSHTHIPAYLHSLEELKLGWLVVSDVTIQYIARRCNHLKSVILVKCDYVTVYKVMALMDGCTGLTTLTASGESIDKVYIYQ